MDILEYSRSRKLSSWIPSEVPLSERRYVSIYLRQDENVRRYKREEYDILTFLGDLGGLLDIILLARVAVSSPFVVRLF